METAKEFLKLENQHARRLIKIMDGLILSIDPTDPTNIRIEDQVGKRANYREIRKANEQLYLLGLKGALGPDERVTLRGIDDYALGEISQHVVSLLGRVGQEMTPALESSLSEGYRRGESYDKLAGRVQAVWDVKRPAAMRLARTASNEIYNQGHLSGYREIGAEYVQFKAIIDSRTSEVCKMTHQTIWAIDDPDILRPPLHFFCRSRLVFFGGKPPKKERDFTKRYDGQEYTQEQVDSLTGKVDTFREKYWQIPTLEPTKIRSDQTYTIIPPKGKPRLLGRK